MEHDPGTVQDAGQPAPRLVAEPDQNVVDDRGRRRRGGGDARGVEHRGDVPLDRWSAEKHDEPRNARFIEDAMECWEATKLTLRQAQDRVVLRGGEMLVEHLADRLLGDEAHDTVDGLPALEEDQARDPR